MKMSELILAVGDENVVFQILLNDAETINKTKRGTKITFYTGQVQVEELILGDKKTNKIGLVLWLPRDKVDAAIAAEKAQASCAPTAQGVAEERAETCAYPNCDCAVSFPEGYKPSLETECPRPRIAPTNSDRAREARWNPPDTNEVTPSEPEQPLERKIAHEIELALQFKDFGRFNDEGDFVATVAQTYAFHAACRAAAIAVISSLPPADDPDDARVSREWLELLQDGLVGGMSWETRNIWAAEINAILGRTP